MTEIKKKPSAIFWVVGVLALIWNLMGASVYLAQAYLSDEFKAAYTKDQLSIIENTPSWVTAAFAIAVWGGLLASILFLLKKKSANLLFTISLIGIIVQVGYNLFLTNSIEVFGTAGLIQPILTVIFGAFLVFYSKKCTDEGILN